MTSLSLGISILTLDIWWFHTRHLLYLGTLFSFFGFVWIWNAVALHREDAQYRAEVRNSSLTPLERAMVNKDDISIDLNAINASFAVGILLPFLWAMDFPLTQTLEALLHKRYWFGLLVIIPSSVALSLGSLLLTKNRLSLLNLATVCSLLCGIFLALLALYGS